MLRPRSSTIRPGHLDQGSHLHGSSSPSYLVPGSHASRLLRQVRERIRRWHCQFETSARADSCARQVCAASPPGAPSFHQRSHELSPIDRRRLLLEWHSLRGPASSCHASPGSNRRDPASDFISSRTAPPVEARGSRHSSDAAPLARDIPLKIAGTGEDEQASARWPATTAGFNSSGASATSNWSICSRALLRCHSCPCRKTTGWS